MSKNFESLADAPAGFYRDNENDTWVKLKDGRIFVHVRTKGRFEVSKADACEWAKRFAPYWPMDMRLYDVKNGRDFALVVAGSALEAKYIARLIGQTERTTVTLIDNNKIASIKTDAGKVIGTAFDLVMDHMFTKGSSGICGSTDND